MSDKIAAGLAIAALLFLIGVIYVGATMPEKPRSQVYTLEIDATRAVGDVVMVDGSSNLPDGARLEVVIDRLYRLQGSELWAAARVGAGEAEVNEGKWRAEIPIDDHRWVEELHGRLSAREVDPIEAVHPSLRATVLFTPLSGQPKHVESALGTNFERLSRSELATEEGDLWVLRRQKDFEMPLSAELQSKLMSEAQASVGFF